MTVLVFGKTGQVALELQARAPEAIYLGRDDVNLADPETCAAAIRAHTPSGVINAAAYTAVDRAEEEEDLATRVNGAAPGAMARTCAELSVPLLHISTDYVFDGQGDRPFAPDHPTAPLGAYGRSKLVGEEAVRSVGAPHVILRTSWVFSKHGRNFLRTMLELGATRDQLSIVADQVGGPTPAGGIAATCLEVMEQIKADPGKSGTYHYAGAPDASWANFARAIFAASGQRVAVKDIPTSAYPTPAARPLNSRLDCASLSARFGIGRPDWTQTTGDIVKGLI